MKAISSVYGRRPYFKVIVGHIATSNGNQLYLDIAGYRILVCIYLTMHGTNLLKSMKNLGHRAMSPKSSTCILFLFFQDEASVDWWLSEC